MTTHKWSDEAISGAVPTANELAATWADVHAANEPLGWFVGQPTEPTVRGLEWTQYAFDPRETPRVGRRTREWTAMAPTQLGVLREMARCLREISGGRAPR